MSGAAAVKPPILAGVQVLLAEDNATNQIVASEMLRSLGAEITLAADGAVALALFEAQAFDLVLLDIEMPRRSGIDVLKAIRRRTDGRQSVPIVALTAYVMPEHRQRITRAGADAIIAKPLPAPADLGRSLRAVLESGVQAAAPTLESGTLDALREALGPEGLDVLLGKVREDLMDALEALLGATRETDIATVRAQTHILMSVAGTVGATELQRSAEALNARAHQTGDMSALVGEVAALAQEINALDAALDQPLT